MISQIQKVRYKKWNVFIYFATVFWINWHYSTLFCTLRLSSSTTIRKCWPWGNGIDNKEILWYTLIKFPVNLKFTQPGNIRKNKPRSWRWKLVSKIIDTKLNFYNYLLHTLTWSSVLYCFMFDKLNGIFSSQEWRWYNQFQR